MTAVACAIAGSAIIGAVASKNASDKAASGAAKGLAATQDSAGQARVDAQNLYAQANQAVKDSQAASLDFYQSNAQTAMRPLIEGNMMAQKTIGQGAQQANNAILGLPVDMSFANNPQQVYADYSGIKSAALPAGAQPVAQLGAFDNSAAEKAAKDAEAKQKAFEKSTYDGSTFGLTMAANDKNRFKIDNILGNPLGIAEDKWDKVNPTKIGKKLIKKIF